MKHIRLKQFDIEYIPPNSIVHSGRLGPCTAVFIYYSKGKEAFAGHFVDPEIDNLERMVQNALSRFKTSTRLEVYVTGNSLDEEDQEQREFESRDRDTVPAILKKYGFDERNTIIRWSPPYTATQLSLNVDTGETKLELEYSQADDPRIVYSGPIHDAPVY